MQVDRTHIEESSAGEKKDVEPPPHPKETVEKEGREEVGWIKSKQMEIVNEGTTN
jgi:hypothetical protein